MPEIHNQKNLNYLRKELRRNSTPEEIIIWGSIRNKKLGPKFYRQHSIGPYIVDFYCAEKRLIIEIDGEHHTQNHEYDSARNEYLENLGFKIVRFWNSEIRKNLDGILRKIQEL